VLRVRDTGRGIAPALLPRVFDPFQQDERSGARTPGGLGLGLAIARGIVELHDGSIEAHSAGPDQGSEFVVRVPALRPAHAPAPSPGPRPRAVTEEDGHSARVLVVDDNLDAATLLGEVLATMGYATRTAGGGAEALELAREVPPEVALIDLGMPGMDGFELARHLREDPDLRTTRLVAVTGYGQSADREATRAAGFDAHLVKPVQVGDVHATLQRLLAATAPAT